MYFFKQFSKDLKKKRGKVFFNSITGKNVQMLYLRLEPGESTSHNHTNEQMGLIIDGEVEIIINGEKQICKPGDGYYIPANSNHGFNVINKKCVEFIEICSTVKEEKNF